MPSIWYSTGSSTVMMLFSGVFSDAERRVERRRFARAGRPGDEHGAVGLVHRPLEALPLLVGQPELVELHHDRVLVEDAHHDRLAVYARQRHDSQVDVSAVDLQPDAAVLRQAPLGDVQVGHDLHARDHPRGCSPWNRRDVLQDAVDAEAHTQLVPIGSEMDV